MTPYARDKGMRPDWPRSDAGTPPGRGARRLVVARGADQASGLFVVARIPATFRQSREGAQDWLTSPKDIPKRKRFAHARRVNMEYLAGRLPAVPSVAHYSRSMMG